MALGNPATVPVGRYAKEALVQAGLWDQLSPRFIYGESVRQVLDYVSRGEVDAGLVFATDAAIAQGKVKVIQTVAGPTPILYPAGRGRGHRKARPGPGFGGFPLSPAAQEIFPRFGFGKP